MSALRKSGRAGAKRRQSAAPGLSDERRLRGIIDDVLRLAKIAGAEEAEVHVDEVLDDLTRFANNAIHQNVSEHGLMVSVRTVAERRTARVTTNRIDENSLRAAIDSSLSLAASQPKDTHLLALPSKQRYRAVQRFSQPTVAVTPEDRARAVRRACDLAIKHGQVAAGIFSTGQSRAMMGNSRGLLAAYRETHAEFSITMQEVPAASWAKANAADVRQFDTQELAARASQKAHLAVDAKELSTGKYTVILEPAAALDLVGFLFYDFAATALADKRSCLTGRMGKPLFGKNITITDDVYHPFQLGAPFDGEGMPRQRVILVDRGVPINLVFSGGDSSIEKMIASTERGLLVTRIWYIREVEPYEKIMTGMTRDGLFLVENGRVTAAVRNFRFNQSLLEALRNVEMLGPAVRATGEEAFEMVMPSMKIRDFHFTEATKF